MWEYRSNRSVRELKEAIQEYRRIANDYLLKQYHCEDMVRKLYRIEDRLPNNEDIIEKFYITLDRALDRYHEAESKYTEYYNKCEQLTTAYEVLIDFVDY